MLLFKTDPNKEDYETLVNFLMAHILIYNGGRASMITGLTVKQFERRVLDKDSDTYTVEVCESSFPLDPSIQHFSTHLMISLPLQVLSHKTGAVYGAAFAVITPEIERCIKGYLNVIRYAKVMSLKIIITFNA